MEGEPTLGIGISESRARFNDFHGIGAEVGAMIEAFAGDFPAE